MNDLKKLTIVISVYNEEESLKSLWEMIKESLLNLDFKYEIIFVNDGSTDDSKNILHTFAQEGQCIKVLNLSANFGHEAAMTAGLDYSTGDAVICMDADLQHPPSLICAMVEKFVDGFEIINMVRSKNEDVGIVKRMVTNLFYTVLNLLSSIKFEPNASDFFLVSRRVADILTQNYRERTRFLRGLIQTIGFRKTSIEYIAPKRISGVSKYSLFKLFSSALIAIATVSNLPLRIGVFLGTIFGMLSIVIGVYSIIMKLTGYVIPGYTTIVVLISFLFGVQFFITGIIGEYIGFLFNEGKQRPIYIIDDKINIPENHLNVK